MKRDIVTFLIAGNVTTFVREIAYQFNGQDIDLDTEKGRIEYSEKCVKACLIAAVIMRHAAIEHTMENNADQYIAKKLGEYKGIMPTIDKLVVLFEDLFKDRKPGDFSKN